MLDDRDRKRRWRAREMFGDRGEYTVGEFPAITVGPTGKSRYSKLVATQSFRRRRATPRRGPDFRRLPRALS